MDLGAFAVVAAELEGLAGGTGFDSAGAELVVVETDKELVVVDSSLLLAVVDRMMTCVVALGTGFGMVLKPAAVEDEILVGFAEACIRPSATPGPYSNSPCLLQLLLVLVQLEYSDTCYSVAFQLANIGWNSNTR